MHGRGIYTWGRPVYKRTSGNAGSDVLTLPLALTSTLTLTLALTLALTPALNLARTLTL